jgi:hypothetical protein
MKAADIDAVHLSTPENSEGIAGLHLEEKDRVVVRKMMQPMGGDELARVFVALACAGPVGQDAERLPAGGLVDEAHREFVVPTPSRRSSVARSTRDTSDDTTMARMNQPAILMASGRSKMLTMVV